MTVFSTLTGVSTTIEPIASIPAWVRPDGVCPAFQWIGQPFTSCDGCGRPYWEHTHQDVPVGDKPYSPFTARTRHAFIPQAQRDRVRRHWTGETA